MGVQIRCLFLDDVTMLGGHWTLEEMVVEGPHLLGALPCPRTWVFTVSREKGTEQACSFFRAEAWKWSVSLCPHLSDKYDHEATLRCQD